MWGGAEPQVFHSKSNYNAIDLAKFICALLVITLHCQPLENVSVNSLGGEINFFVQEYLARIAVPFFFVASGFFLYRKTTLEEFSLEPTKKYSFRLLRLYLIWTTIYFPLSFYEFFKDKEGMLHAILIYIRNTIVVTSYIQLWYINATIFAVILISFLLYKKVNLKRILICSFIFFFLGLFAQSWFGFIRPLKEVVPVFWNVLKQVKAVMLTTRNGLFDAFPFISIGMCFALGNIRISHKKSLAGFLASLLALCVEVYTLHAYSMPRATDMYLCLVPVTFFGFSFIRDMKLSDNSIYKTLRVLSTLVFLTHMWIYIIIRKTVEIFRETLHIPLPAITTLTVTIALSIACSLIVIKLSEIPRLRWLKILYS